MLRPVPTGADLHPPHACPSVCLACPPTCLPSPLHRLRSAVKDATGTSVSTFGLHRRLGIVAMTLGLAQLTALVFRCAEHLGTVAL